MYNRQHPSVNYVKSWCCTLSRSELGCLISCGTERGMPLYAERLPDLQDTPNLVLCCADRISFRCWVNSRAFIKEDAYVTDRLSRFRSSCLAHIPHSRSLNSTHY